MGVGADIGADALAEGPLTIWKVIFNLLIICSGIKATQKETKSHVERVLEVIATRPLLEEAIAPSQESWHPLTEQQPLPLT